MLELAARGIRVSLAGKDRVTVDGPANMSDDDIALARSHKAVILESLRRSEAEQTKARTAAIARFREAVWGEHVH